MGQSPLSRDNAVRRVIFIEGSVNIIVLCAKLSVGLLTGSMAILVDAVHSLADIANNFIAFFIIKVSSLPPDREHPYGHRKFETLAVFFLATLLTVIAFELGIHAVKKDYSEVVSGGLELGVMLAVLAVNVGLAVWQRAKAKQYQSDILLADASHTLSDVLTTCVVIIGWQLSAQGMFIFDKICAIGVALLVFYLAFNLFRKAAPILLDQVAIAPELLTEAALAVSGVQNVKSVRSRQLGSETYVDMVVTVDHALSTAASHAIADNVESRIKTQYGVSDISIHVEPELCS